uniref:N-acetyltransferase domain-containing protein n=1 Tax=Crouania attenuata TaxID=42002 RepID=A0A4D6WNR3_9FLOR|nr:hypothetical protein [Crouania attenuata]
MTFWNIFFNKPTIQNSSKSGKYHQDKILLVQNIKTDNDVQEIYFTLSKEINLYDLEQLCDSVGWVKRPLQKVKIALEHSFLTICVFKKQHNLRKLIGFARATSDHSFNATIWDVAIHPTFQKQGLGKILMNQVIKELRSYDISTITLFADPEVINFYKNLGFITDPDGVKGMFWYPL